MGGTLPPYIWLCGLKVRTPSFQDGNAVFKSRQSHYDFVAKLVKASDCNSEGVSSTLTEIFMSFAVFGLVL